MSHSLRAAGGGRLLWSGGGEGYWLRRSFWSMVWDLWMSLRSPWTQARASSGVSATKSRVPCLPWNTSVKQRSGGNSEETLRRRSD
uniref:Uncharacterized protein n=1 Tax=Knipowitschia caucasica TaxID=637954 RepID=A0AAV2JUH2_KNICA